MKKNNKFQICLFFKFINNNFTNQINGVSKYLFIYFLIKTVNKLRNGITSSKMAFLNYKLVNLALSCLFSDNNFR